MTKANHLSITPLNPTIGAVVAGIDLRDGHSDGVIEDVRAALLAHKVLFFEDQDLTPAQQRDFAARLAKCTSTPSIRPTTPCRRSWCWTTERPIPPTTTTGTPT